MLLSSKINNTTSSPPVGLIQKSIHLEKKSRNYITKSITSIFKVIDPVLDRVSVELHGHYSSLRVTDLEVFFAKSKSSPLLIYGKTVLAATLIPALSILALYVVNVLIPLSNAFDGLLVNHSFLKRSTLEVFVACAEIVVMLNAQMPDLKLGFFGMVVPALVYASVHYIQLGILPYAFQSWFDTLEPWFPFPYTIHVTAPICWIFTAATLVLFIRNPFFESYQTYRQIPDAWKRLSNYIILETVQFLLIMVYTAYGALYRYAGADYPMTLLCLLVAMKFSGKMLISSLSERYTGDTSPMLVVFTAELFNAIYTSFALQSSSSNYSVIASLMFVDVMQNIFYYANFVKYTRDSTLMPKTKSTDSLAKVAIVRVARPRSSSVVVAISDVAHTDSPVVSKSKLAKHPGTRNVLDNAPLNSEQLKARFFSVSEHLVLTEYVEFITPLIYASFLAIMYSTGNKEFYAGLRSSEFSAQDLQSAITSLLVLAAMEAISFAMLYVIIKRMVGINAFCHLGYVLNKHFVLAVVTLTMWLIITSAFKLDHNGCDMTFAFEWIK